MRKALKHAFPGLSCHIDSESVLLSANQRPRPIDLSSSVSLCPLALTQATIQKRGLPVLPREIWCIIFRFATEDDAQLAFTKASDRDETSFLSFPRSHSDTGVRLEHYLGSIRMKHNLMRVCKQWSLIALENLYECVWIYKSTQARTLAEALTRKDGSGEHHNGAQKGRYIKFLRIETRTWDRCSPDDLRVIIDNVPCLEVYMDYRSVHQTICALRLCSITQASRPIRRLSWTYYNNLTFHLCLSPSLANVASRLEFLELFSCDMDIYDLKEPLSGHPGPPLTLLHLRALKVCLHDATLSVLATWDLPVMRNVSIVAADFSYAGDGFCNFFRTHGKKLQQLELVHSSSIIDWHYLTIPVDSPTNTLHTIDLALWCPNLEEFICSSYTEWNWQNPSWVAPHVWLLSHPNLRLIGIHDLDKRVTEEVLTRMNPFCPLLSQFKSFICHNAFPKLHVIRDLSLESKNMRSEGPSNNLMEFWSQILRLCAGCGVQLQDYAGMAVNHKDLICAQLKAVLLKEEKQAGRKKLVWWKQNPTCSK